MTTTRRGFMATLGAAGAVLGVPAVANPSAGAPRGWASLRGSAVPALRAAYLAEIARLAEELRPRFESGELGGFGDDDGPMDRLERLCAERFGLQVTKRGPAEYEGGDEEHARLILFVSPSSDTEVVDWGNDWNHPCLAARCAVALDVLQVARARGGPRTRD